MYLGASCYGHGEDDILEFSGFIDDDTYTNSEFLEFIHPWNEDLLYTYDTFDFDYCADVGYEFDPMSVSMPKIGVRFGAGGGVGGGGGVSGPGAGAGGMGNGGGDRFGKVRTSSESSSTTTNTASTIDKSTMKARHAARKASVQSSSKVKADIPIELVTGITSIAELKAYSESRRRL